MSHQVFIERCRDSKPETAEALAKAIAQRYGVAPEQISSRLKQGRFQVKANLEIATARTFMSYLEEQGALCSIVAADGEVVARSAALEKKEEPPQDFLELSPAENAPQLALMTPPPPADITGDGSDYESGLSAGFSATGDQELGALGASTASKRPLRLETLDGTSEEETAAEPNASVADVSDVAAFMPPDMLEEQKFELDVEPERTPPPPAYVPDPSSNEEEEHEEVAASSSSRLRAATGGLDEESVAKAPAVSGSPPHLRALRALSNHERLRFAVGILLAVFVGFVIMSLVASSREASRYSTIIAELKAQYDAAETSVAWDALDGARSTTLENLQVRRRNIVIMSVFVWLIVTGLFAFLWLRVFDWSRWEEATVGGP